MPASPVLVLGSHKEEHDLVVVDVDLLQIPEPLPELTMGGDVLFDEDRRADEVNGDLFIKVFRLLGDSAQKLALILDLRGKDDGGASGLCHFGAM